LFVAQDHSNCHTHCSRRGGGGRGVEGEARRAKRDPGDEIGLKW